MPLIDPDDSVLVVVDTQPGFVKLSARTDEDEATAAAALDRLAWLAGVATLLEIPAVVVEEDPGRNGSTEARVFERLPPGTLAIAKPTFGLAGHPEAVAAVRATGRMTAVLVGFETDVCVAQSAIGLHDLGFGAVVVEDAAYSGDELQHQRGLARMTEAGVERNHCKGLFYEWCRTVERARETIRAAAEFGPPPLGL